MRNDFLNIGMQLLHAKAFQIPSYFSKKCETIAPCPLETTRKQKHILYALNRNQ